MYLKGEGNRQDTAKAFYWFEIAALQGDVSAQKKLGYVYYTGEGVSVDINQAIFWYKKAAEQEDAEAFRELGHIYESSFGANDSISQAIYCYKKAAGHDDIIAQVKLADMFYFGVGTVVNKEQAFYWYKKAAEKDNFFVQMRLGLMYMDGVGTTADTVQSVLCLKKAGFNDIEMVKKLDRSMDNNILDILHGHYTCNPLIDYEWDRMQKEYWQTLTIDSTSVLHFTPEFIFFKRGTAALLQNEWVYLGFNAQNDSFYFLDNRQQLILIKRDLTQLTYYYDMDEGFYRKYSSYNNLQKVSPTDNNLHSSNN